MEKKQIFHLFYFNQNKNKINTISIYVKKKTKARKFMIQKRDSGKGKNEGNLSILNLVYTFLVLN